MTSTNPYTLDPFFELSEDLICIAGYDGYFRRINPAVSKLLGYTEEELFSRPISSFIHPDDQDLTAKHRDNLIKNNPLLNFENRYVTKDGNIVWLCWTSMPLHSKELVYAIAKNITHIKKQEGDRNLLLANLTKINKELKQITYTTSHDLRAPVNNLLSVFSILDISKIEDSETLIFIKMLNSAANSLKRTLNDYVDILSEKNDLSQPIEEINLHQCLNIVLSSISILIQDSKTLIDIDFSELETIQFNKAYLESIFLNLMTNAIKYAQPGQPPEIFISSKKVNGTSQLVFSDKGIGFDMDQVKNKIFRMHQTFHDHNDSKGIGLYLVHNHITSLGGQIHMESTLNKGTTFTLSFKD